MGDEIWLILAVITLLGAALSFIWLVLSTKRTNKGYSDNLIAAAESDARHIFSEEFREELKNRGRLHFENILNENAMFLQQDLRLTTSELSEYMREEIKNVLKSEFKHYEESINTAKDQAIESIKKTQTAIEQQRQILEEQLKEQIAAEKEKLITKFEDHMAEIINYYISEATSGELDLSTQMDFVLTHLEANKKALIEDIKGGA